MRLSDQDIREFIEAWEEAFGETLDFEAARSEAHRLVDFFVWMATELSGQRQYRPARTDDSQT